MFRVNFDNSQIMKFIRREKRFFAYMNDSGVEMQVYCCNSGRMADILMPESDCVVTPKLSGIPYEWQAIKIGDTWIGVNTSNPNKLVKLLLSNLFPEDVFRQEVTFGQYKADFASSTRVIEVKNVHWKIGDIAYFPDCVTSRGARQIMDLIELSDKYECYVIYIVQRNDVSKVSNDPVIDGNYYKNVQLSIGKIKYLAFNCNINEKFVEINGEIEVI